MKASDGGVCHVVLVRYASEELGSYSSIPVVSWCQRSSTNVHSLSERTVQAWSGVNTTPTRRKRSVVVTVLGFPERNKYTNVLRLYIVFKLKIVEYIILSGRQNVVYGDPLVEERFNLTHARVFPFVLSSTMPEASIPPTCISGSTSSTAASVVLPSWRRAAIAATTPARAHAFECVNRAFAKQNVQGPPTSRKYIRAKVEAVWL